jgi:ADP-ribosylglycohydrolase
MEKTIRTQLAKKSLLGVSIGDAFGDSFFGKEDVVLAYIQKHQIPPTKWEFTDDTVMAIAVYEQIVKNQTINQDELALLFASNHNKDENRGYGATARRILREIGEGNDWKSLSYGVFEGMGSMGNGASMRVSSIGAYFYDDLEKVKELAKLSAEITHANIEAITGAIAVALATALATQVGLGNMNISPDEFIQSVVAELPESDTKSKINKGLVVSYSYHIETVKSMLGNGSQIIAQDTIPFAIWCAAHNLKDFEKAIWKAVSILGDRDTICAIVGGIVSMSAHENTIPKLWLENVEKVEESIFWT